MNAEKYTFTVSKNWETIVRLVPNNAWIEKNYTFSVSWLSEWTVTTTAEIKKVPQTWTEENIAIVVIISAIIYFWYKKAYRKH
jgi:hypothetical protein